MILSHENRPGEIVILSHYVMGLILKQVKMFKLIAPQVLDAALPAPFLAEGLGPRRSTLIPGHERVGAHG